MSTLLNKSDLLCYYIISYSGYNILHVPKILKKHNFQNNEIENFQKMVSRKNDDVREFFRNFHSVRSHWKTKKSLPCKIFSSNHFTVKFFNKKLVSRNFCKRMLAVNKILAFPHSQCVKKSHQKDFSPN